MFRLILIFLSLSLPVSAQTYYEQYQDRSNAITFDNQGNSWQRLGNTTFRSDGTTYQDLSTTTYGNRGETWQRQEPYIFESDGSLCLDCDDPVLFDPN